MGARSSQSRGPGLNETDGHLLEYFRNTFSAGGGGNSGNNTPIPNPGITATGGVISDYTSGSDIYRAHVFNSSGIFDVSALSQNPDIPDTVEYLVVAGGGSGGAQGAGAGAGGAGGLRTNLPGVQDAGGNPLTGAAFPVSDSPGEYTVTIGAGAVGGSGSGYGNHGSRGTPSVFGSITSTGGGGGGTSSGGGNDPQAPGGSGGGRGGAEPGAAYLGNTPPVSPSQGFAGGQTGSGYQAGGGGGAGAVGQQGQPDRGGAGGAGVQVAIAGPTATTFTGVGAKNPANNQYQYFAGGGGGGAYPSPEYQAAGGLGGGGAGGYNPDQNGKHGEVSTGGGGGGADGNAPIGGSGGSGIVIVRYKLGTVAATAKATGGAISFYNSGSGLRTIHTFTGSGTFATEPNWNAADVEYVVIGGGGAGGSNAGTGGGAGAYRTGSTPIGAHPVSTSIQVGAGGVGDIGATTATSGTESYFGSPITSPGGGKGTINSSGTAGGSGGGGNSGGTGTGDPFPGTIQATPANGWGNDGGNQSGSGASRCGGGGGGAGGVGGNGSAPDGGGNGGTGVQLPSTFRDPASSVGGTGPTSALTNGDTSGKYWVAGGGGGSTHHPGGHPGGSGGGAPPSISPYSTPWSGGGAGGKGNYPNFTDPERFAKNGENGTGGGGGASAGGGSLPGGFGGSGIVLIAYPS